MLMDHGCEITKSLAWDAREYEVNAVKEAWREAYHESINPIAVPEDAWSMPEDVVVVNVLPPESRKSVGRNRKRRYETVEDKIRSSQTSQKRQPRKLVCSSMQVVVFESAVLPCLV
ncbi:hypothetical protein DY000_02048070 [Brassica cretica]|uniref:Uncharacterized protein n=1 Tax=Brassica cretica TaxID=69181 RepID=A0ABQ7F8E8_BRACR|nr:hypothetical protein DY000_02048070 [Brassica cretica]